MSWGVKIALLYIGFITLILTLVIRSVTQSADLEYPDYYAREVKFQDQIDGKSALQNTGVSPSINATPESVNLAMPSKLTQAPFNGSVTFSRADDAALDRTFTLDSTDSLFVYARKEFVGGLYTVRVDWSSAGEKYYYESAIYVP